MTIDPNIVEDVLDSLQETIRTLRKNNDNQRARDLAESFKLRGQLLAIQPEFIKQAALRCPQILPSVLVESTSQLLWCIAAAADDQKSALSITTAVLNNGHHQSAS